MSTYTCPHCGQHDLSTQRRHNCPKLPSLSIPLGPPRSMDPCANEYIARLTRELEEARERERSYMPERRNAYRGAYTPIGGDDDRHPAQSAARRRRAADSGDADGRAGDDAAPGRRAG